MNIGRQRPSQRRVSQPRLTSKQRCENDHFQKEQQRSIFLNCEKISPYIGESRGTSFPYRQIVWVV